MTLQDAKVRRTAPLQTRSNLSAKSVKVISAALTEMLADMFALYLKTKNFHWHVSGPHFRDYHLLLDEQQKAIERHWDKAVEENLAIDRLSCATFGQEIQAADGLGLFKDAIEYRERFEVLAKLRNTVYHAAEFAVTPEQALKLPKHVRDAQIVTTWLQRHIEGLAL